jgi:RNA recognition motif-containing protein
MEKKLYVGSLSWDTTDDNLRQAFGEFGDVTDARVIIDRQTGRSRGFGFVTFAREADAMTAMERMHGTSLDGKTIKVNEARERKPRGGGRGRGAGFGSGYRGRPGGGQRHSW